MGAQSQVAEDSLLGFGTLLQMQRDGGSYVTLAGVMDIDGPELATYDVAVTHQESPGATKEYRPGLKEGGAVSFDVVYLPGGPAHGNSEGGLAYEYAHRNVRNWRICWPDGDCATGTMWSFAGYINGFPPPQPAATPATQTGKRSTPKRSKPDSTPAARGG